MREDKLNDYVSGIDDAFIRESASVRGGMKMKKAGIIVSAMKIAACLLLAVGITTAAVFLPQMRKPGAGGSTDVTESDVTSGDNIGIGHDRRHIGFTTHDVSPCFPYYPGTYSGVLYRVATKDVNDYTAYVIASVADLDDYIDGYQALIKNEPEYRKPDTKALAEIKSRYGESYFENRDLIFLPVCDTTTAVTFRIMSLTVKDGAVTLEISYYEPEVGNAQELNFCVAIETEEKLNSDKPVYVRFADNDTFTGVSETGVIFRIDTTTPSSVISPRKIIRSKQDAENYLYRYVKNEEDAKELKSYLDRYDDEFFKTNYIAVVTTTLGSSMYQPEIDSVSDSWNRLNITIGYTVPEGDVTTDILPITIVIPIAGQIAENSTCDLNIIKK